jgi:hypothetical protein
VYIQAAGVPRRRAEAARALAAQIENGMTFIRQNYRFGSDADRAIALGRFVQGQQYYAGLAV